MAVTTGTDADELLNGTPDPDLIVGVGGADTVFAGDGLDVLLGGLGDDTLHGEAGDDLIYGELGGGTVTVLSDSVSDAVEALSPIGYWRLSDGGTTALDETATGNDGTYRNGAAGDQPGAFPALSDGAAAFDGSDDYVEIPHDPAYELANGSVQFWFKADSLGGDQGLWSKDSSGYDSGGHLSIYLDGSQLEVRLQSTGQSYFVDSASGAVSAGTWHHVAFTFGSGGMQLYLDGALVDSDGYTGGLTGNTEPIAIGADTGGSGNGTVSPVRREFDGAIDEVAIFDSQLGAQQVADLYAARLNPSEVTAPVSDDDLLYGGDGDDSLIGGAGDDTLDGGLGEDALYGDSPPGGGNSYTDQIAGRGDSGATDLLGHWRFDDGSGSIAADEVRPNDGSYEDGAAPGAAGIVGQAADFDGSNDYVEIPHDAAYEIDEGWLQVWFRPDSTGGTQGIVSKDSTDFDTGGHLYMRLEGTSLAVRMQSTSASYDVSSASGAVAAGEWHHALLAWGPDGMRLYLDGQLVDSDAYTGGLSGNQNPWAVGANAWQTADNSNSGLNEFFEGQIDEFSVHSGPPSDGDAAAFYAAGLYAADSGGGAGADTLTGGGGDDLLYGGPGNDDLDGGGEADTLFGGSGDDTLAGDAGADLLYGDRGVAGTTTTTLLDTGFDAGAAGFAYLDDAFRGTSQPAYADGGWDATGGQTGGGLQLDMPGLNNADIFGRSGGFQTSFSLTEAGPVSLTFSYRLEVASQFENDEYGEVLVALDGNLVGLGANDYVARIAGGGDSGWTTLTLDLGTLAAGSHTLTLGGYNNKKTAANEDVQVSFDDVKLEVETAVPATPGDDLLTGGAGADALYGGQGDDVLEGGAEDDILVGDRDPDPVVPAYNAGTGLAGEVYDSAASIGGLTDALAVLAGSPVGTFQSSALDYPQGASDTGGSDVAAFLGSDAASLSGGGATAMDTVVFRWTGYLKLDAGTHDFSVSSDDGFRLTIGGEVVTEFTGNRPFGTSTGSASFAQSGLYEVELIYWENGGLNGIEVTSSATGGTIVDSALLFQSLSDAGPDFELVANGGAPDAYVPLAVPVFDETSQAGDGADTLTGGSGNDSLAGNGGADTLDAGEGDDRLFGGDGDDTLEGWTGADSLDGGAGDDTITWDSADLYIRGGSGLDTLVGWNGDDVIVLDDAAFGAGSVANGGFERIELGGGNDRLIGDRVFAGATDLTVEGGAGEDVISLWGNGADSIYGGADSDWIWAGDGDDLVEGGAGVDYLYGGAGTDTLRGNAGDDVFYVGRGDGSVTIEDGVGSNGLVLFHGWNESALFDGVKAGEAIFAYDDVNSVVTLTLADGADADGSDDATVSFAYGDIAALNLWDKTDGTVSTSAPAFDDYAVVEYLWNDITDRFELA